MELSCLSTFNCSIAAAAPSNNKACGVELLLRQLPPCIHSSYRRTESRNKSPPSSAEISVMRRLEASHNRYRVGFGDYYYRGPGLHKMKGGGGFVELPVRLIKSSLLSLGQIEVVAWRSGVMPAFPGPPLRPLGWPTVYAVSPSLKYHIGCTNV